MGSTKNIPQNKNAVEYGSLRGYDSLIVKNLTNFIFLLNTDGRIVFVSTSVIQMTHISEDSLIGKYFWDISLWGSEESIMQDIKHTCTQIHDAGTHAIDLPVNMYTDVFAPSVTHLTFSYCTSGATPYILVEGCNNTVQKQLQYENTLLYKSITDSSVVGIGFWNTSGYITDMNDQLCSITGYTKEDVLHGIKWKEITPPEYESFDNQALQEALLTGTFTPFEKEYIRKDGKRVPVLVGGGLMQPYKDKGVFFVLDISSQKETEKQIHEMVYYDQLTGLPNKSLLQKYLQEAIDTAEQKDEKFALLLVDIDRFKTINDSLGHIVGDQLLTQIAQRFQKSFPNKVIGRIIGDEFIFIFQKAKYKDAIIKYAEKILKTLEKPFSVEAYELYVTATIGISIYPKDGGTIDELLKNADIAMYTTKLTNKSSYKFYTKTMNDKALERLKLENHLREAIIKEELQVYYQPIIDTRSKKIVGMEALVRWPNKKIGNLMPDDFLGIAQETGLSSLIDKFVLKEAFMQNLHWRKEGYQLTLAVNISTNFFREKHFISQLHEIVGESLPPGFLELEITEGTLMENTSENILLLNKIKGMHIGLSIDDFGTGYSSLSYLKYFPIDKLKIDRSFINNMHYSNNDKLIVKSIISLAKNLKLKVVAEGVEKVEQLHFLERQNCNQIQGFYFSHAISKEEFSEFLKKDVKRQKGKLYFF